MTKNRMKQLISRDVNIACSIRMENGIFYLAKVCY